MRRQQLYRGAQSRADMTHTQQQKIITQHTRAAPLYGFKCAQRREALYSNDFISAIFFFKNIKKETSMPSADLIYINWGRTDVYMHTPDIFPHRTIFSLLFSSCHQLTTDPNDCYLNSVQNNLKRVCTVKNKIVKSGNVRLCDVKNETCTYSFQW